VTEDGNGLPLSFHPATVIEALEDADDYAAFEMATTADYDAQSAVERELVLRLASLLWRLRRATAIESGLFRIQAKHLLQFRRRRQAHRDRQTIIDELYGNADASGDDLRPDQNDLARGIDTRAPSPDALADQTDDLTHAFVRLSNLATYPLDRLSRYEATLWRQACQILFALQCLDRRKPWDIMKHRARRGP
jgi:hypothetical protein